MRFNNGIKRLQKEPMYNVAVIILNGILHREIPEDLILEKLYGPAKAKYIKEDLVSFYETNPIKNPVVREHLPNSSTEISDKRSLMDVNEDFQKIQSMLLFNKLPEVEKLEKIYGEYAGTVHEVFRLFLEIDIKRKCGINSACHLNRVGAVVHALKLDEYYSRKYVTVAALHDTIEDLFFMAKDKNGKKFSLEHYDEFVDQFIPAPLTESIKLLTNHFHLIIYHCVEQLHLNDKSITKENLLTELEKLTETACNDIRRYTSEIYDLLKNEELRTDIIETAKWLTYKNLYIVEMARLSHEQRNYRPFEIKAVDLSDNGHGRDALPMFSRIKNIIKQGIWAREGYALRSTWLPLNNRVMEIQEDALIHAEHFVIRDLLEPQSTQDFLVSALLKIKELEPIFYV